MIFWISMGSVSGVLAFEQRKQRGRASAAAGRSGGPRRGDKGSSPSFAFFDVPCRRQQRFFFFLSERKNFLSRTDSGSSFLPSSVRLSARALYDTQRRH